MITHGILKSSTLRRAHQRLRCVYLQARPALAPAFNVTAGHRGLGWLARILLADGRWCVGEIAIGSWNAAFTGGRLASSFGRWNGAGRGDIERRLLLVLAGQGNGGACGLVAFLTGCVARGGLQKFCRGWNGGIGGKMLGTAALAFTRRLGGGHDGRPREHSSTSVKIKSHEKGRDWGGGAKGKRTRD